MITPELVTKIARATRDYGITQTEFQQIMNTLTNTVAGVLTAAMIGLLIGSITKKFTKETRLGPKRKITPEIRAELAKVGIIL